MDWWVIALIALAVLAVALTVGARYTLTHAFLADKKRSMDYFRDLYSGRCHDPERCRALIEKMVALDVEKVYVKSHDGLALVGYYHPGRFRVRRGEHSVLAHR